MYRETPFLEERRNRRPIHVFLTHTAGALRAAAAVFGRRRVFFYINRELQLRYYRHDSAASANK